MKTSVRNDLLARSNFVSALLHSTTLTHSMLAISLVSGMSLAASTAQADDLELPTSGTVVGGSATINYGQPGQLDVNQGSDRVVIDWNSFNIGKDATTTFYQPGSSSLAVNRVTGAGEDPTKILGTLKANGRVMVLDRNGVVFGQNSRVDVAGIVASTGEVDTAAVMSGSDRLELKNFGDGEVVNNGTISVSDGGLAALVAPTVRNNGTINARFGRVALASGEKVTVDLYGDNLIELALDSNASKAVIEQSGTINAEGGTVQITARAAKDVVDSVINMDGIINASSVTQDGGRIVLSGDNVNVNGTMNVNGKNAGKVTVEATKKINVGKKASITASATTNTGKAGTVLVQAQESAVVAGTIEAKGAEDTGFVDTSAADLSFTDTASVITTGEWLIDPTNITIGNIMEALLELQLLFGDATVTTPGIGMQAGNIYVENRIDWATNNRLTLNAINNIVFTTNAAGFAATGTNGRVVLNAGNRVDMSKGTGISTNGGDITLNAQRVKLTSGTINANGGNILIDNSAGLEALANSIRTTGTGTITVNQNKDGSVFFSTNTIQNVINAIDNSGTGTNTINVGAGTFAENITIDRSLVLNGANSGVAGDGVRGAETVIGAGGTAVHVTAGKVKVDGVAVNSGTTGIHADGANNVTLTNNLITGTSGDGVKLTNSDRNTVSNNKIHDVGGRAVSVTASSDSARINSNLIFDTGAEGIYVADSNSSIISANSIGFTDRGVTPGAANNINGDGILIERASNMDVPGTQIIDNDITNTTSLKQDYGSGVHVRYSGHVKVDGNNITDTAWDGVRFYDGKDNVASNNDIRDVARTGIYLTGLSESSITNNTINNAKTYAGIDADNSIDTTITGNDIDGVALAGINITNLRGKTLVDGNTIEDAGQYGIHTADTSNLDITNNNIGLNSTIGSDGILIERSTNAAGTRTTVSGNEIANTISPAQDFGSGVQVRFSSHVDVNGNNIHDTGWDGVRLYDGSDNTATNNNIDNVFRTGIYLTGQNSAAILDNSISNVQNRFGINADNSTDTTINRNVIDGVELAGINITNLRGKTVVDGNKVDNTGSYGIHTADTSNLDITNNQIGLGGGIGGGGAFKALAVGGGIGSSTIGSDGILIERSTNAAGTRTTVSGNEIANTISPAQDFGSGVQVRFSSHVDVNNNNIHDTGWDGVRLYDGSDNTATNNMINNVFRTGIYLTGQNSADILSNTITNVQNRFGINADNSVDTTITGNVIDGVELTGINMTNLRGLTTVENNDIGNTGLHGIATSGVEDIDLNNNIVTTVAGSGIYIGGTTYGQNRIAGNTINGADVGMTFESGLIDLTSTANSVTGGRLGFLFAPIASKGGFTQVDLAGDTIGNTAFAGQSSYYVELRNGALFAPGTPTLEDGLNASYDGFSPISVGGVLTPAQLAALEAKFFHFNDDPTVGLFFFGTAVSTFAQNRVFREDVSGFAPDAGNAGFTITGLPRLPGAAAPAPIALPDVTDPAALNALAPAAGGENPTEEQQAAADPTAEELAAISPAAGGEETSCWGDAVSLASSGQMASYSFSSDPTAILNDTTSCGTQAAN